MNEFLQKLINCNEKTVTDRREQRDRKNENLESRICRGCGSNRDCGWYRILYRFGSVPMIGEQGLSLSDLGKASKIAKLVDTYYLVTKKVMKTVSIRWKKVCTVDW